MERERTLRENQAAAKQLDDIRLEFARVAHDFAFVLEEIKEELTQPVFCQSAAEVQWKQVSHHHMIRRALFEGLEQKAQGPVPQFP